MASELPYFLTTKRFNDLFSKIQTAAVPERFTFEFLKKLGLTSSNDRAFPGLLKKLGFLDASGVPTERYKSYRHKTDAPHILAQGIRELYSELFSINENIYKESKDTIKGIISRVTGQEERYVNLIANTFSALVSLAEFKVQTTPTSKEIKQEKSAITDLKETIKENKEDIPKRDKFDISFRHNIEIHLPATTDISVYNAIFKSIKEHLGE